MMVPNSTILFKLLFKKLEVVQKVTTQILKLTLKTMTHTQLYKALGKFWTPTLKISLLHQGKSPETLLRSRSQGPNKIKNNSKLKKFNEILKVTKSQNKKFKKLSLKLKMLILRNPSRPRNSRRKEKWWIAQLMATTTSSKKKTLNLITKILMENLWTNLCKIKTARQPGNNSIKKFKASSEYSGRKKEIR